MKTLTDRIKIHAQQLGLSLAGITQPRPSDHSTFYSDWLARGYHGEMRYIARADAVRKRADVRRVMPEAQSIVVVGMNYYPGEFPSAKGHRGRVSRYAWGADYHDVMLKKVHQLAGWIDQQLRQQMSYRAYVDTGPLLERELAQRAGLGWIGKNTNLIHPKMGSYFFLGELLVDLELEPTPPFSNERCGNCTACLDACPTGALTAPHTIDARRCISYLTIEHRGAIPEEVRPLIGNWVFGCDVCQEVCPWNKRFAHPAPTAVLHPQHSTLDLIEMLALDEDVFRSRFRNTPLWRARRAGLLRNAAVVLGNLGDPATIPALERALADPEPLVAEHASWALSHVV